MTNAGAPRQTISREMDKLTYNTRFQLRGRIVCGGNRKTAKIHNRRKANIAALWVKRRLGISGETNVAAALTASQKCAPKPTSYRN